MHCFTGQDGYCLTLKHNKGGNIDNKRLDRPLGDCPFAAATATRYASSRITNLLKKQHQSSKILGYGYCSITRYRSWGPGPEPVSQAVKKAWVRFRLRLGVPPERDV